MPKSILPLAFFVLVSAGDAASAAIDLGSLPRLKNGLWVTTITNEGLKPARHSICVDDATQQHLLTMGQGAMTGMCAKADLRRDGSAFIFESDCAMGPVRVKSSSRTTFTGATGYHTEATTRFDPPILAKGTVHTVAQGRHSGACPAGMKPGDMTLPDGRVVNVNNFPGSMGPR